MVLATLVGFVAIAGAGGAALFWWRTQLEPTTLSEVEPGPAPEPSEPTPVRPATPSPTLSETNEPRQEMRDCPECPEMVLVPAGDFTMGSPPDEPGRDDDEGPQRMVTIPEPFWVSKYEVTSAEWDACADAAECTNEEGDDNRPVIVSWNDAKAYVFWLSERAGKTYRLLSESEWEYASRASSTTAFWWGKGRQRQCQL